MAENVSETFKTLTKEIALIHHPDSAASNPKGHALGFSQQDESPKAKAASRTQPDGEKKEFSKL